MHQTVQNLLNINTQTKAKINELKYNNYKAEIIAISKTFPISHILPLIEHGHKDFGENKVQEAVEKWTEIKNKNKEIRLHMVGKLQTNKVKYVLPLFDYIHSLDNLKLAKKISEEQKKQSEQKTAENKVVNKETQIKAKEKKLKQVDDKQQEKNQSSSSKKKEKDSKD